LAKPKAAPSGRRLHLPVSRTGTFGLAVGYRFAPSGETIMPTASGHTTAILASKVKGTPVYNVQGEKVGTVEDVVLDKTSNNIMFAVLGSGGVLGVGEKYRPVPWSVLDYDQKMGGYVVPLDRQSLDKAPAYRMEDLTRGDGGGAIMSETYSYYKVPAYWE
jgi:sporulation protein YlmC with PRC-barrel domain